MSNKDILDSNVEDPLSIDGYIIKERIGVGSYGRVYKVLKNNIYYVLKEIPLNSSNAEEKINMVQNEAKILSSLNNKYIVKFYKSFKKNQSIYILMEYCENGDLCSFLNQIKKKRKGKNHFLNEDFVWKLFIQMCIGLYHIHSKKIIHRDIKTLNIFLTKDLDAKIGDLGVAKVLQDKILANTFIGTPYYISPEMCKNKPYNEKSDIWALGCILYELLTFEHPFTARNQAALFIKILKSNFNPLPPNTPEDLKSMVEYILQKNCQKRPSMEEIIKTYSFQYNAIRVGLEKDLKDVLAIDKLPIYDINKILNENSLINNSHIFFNSLYNNEINNSSRESLIKSHRNSLIVSKSFNPMNLNDKIFYKISSKNKVVNRKYIFKNKSFKNDFKFKIKQFNKDKIYISQESDDFINKRNRSELNYKINFNTGKKQKIIKIQKKIDNKNTKDNCSLFNIEEKNNNFNIKSKNYKKNNIFSYNTNFHINNRRKIKEYEGKNINNLINNCISYNVTESSEIKTDRKNKILKNKKNLMIKIFDSPNNKIVNESKIIKKNTNYQKEISIENIIKRKKKKKYTLIKKYIKNNNKEKDNNNLQESEIILESEFMKELNNIIKSNPIIINLNDLLNFNFNSNDSKNLNTSSANASLGKFKFPIIKTEEIDGINEDNTNIKEKHEHLKNIEDGNLEIFNNYCDEFTQTEMIKRSEPNLSNKIPFSNYKIKLNENKKEIKHIIEMPKDELMMSTLLFKSEYEKYMDKFKKYSDIIDINEVKNLYKDIRNLNDKELKKNLNFIVNIVKKRIPEKNMNELIDLIYNIIIYDIKYKVAENTIKKI